MKEYKTLTLPSPLFLLHKTGMNICKCRNKKNRHQILKGKIYYKIYRNTYGLISEKYDMKYCFSHWCNVFLYYSNTFNSYLWHSFKPLNDLEYIRYNTGYYDAFTTGFWESTPIVHRQLSWVFSWRGETASVRLWRWPPPPRSLFNETPPLK